MGMVVVRSGVGERNLDGQRIGLGNAFTRIKGSDSLLMRFQCADTRLCHRLGAPGAQYVEIGAHDR